MAIKGTKNTTRRKSKKSKKVQLLSGSNLSILLLGITSILFLGSIINRHIKGGMEIPDFSVNVPSPLSMPNYDTSELKNIEAEVLNGCGISGIAQQFTDYLRKNYVDVIRTENADNFNYEETIVILRRGDVEKVKEIARILAISPSDSIRVIVDTDESLLTDVTIIIGSDYLDIEPIQRFLRTQL